MEVLYFPESLYIKAHNDYPHKTGKSQQEVRDYCINNMDFFVEVVFSYVDGEPYPEMKS